MQDRTSDNEGATRSGISLNEAHRRAQRWWATQTRLAARCDACCAQVPRGEGYLLLPREIPGAWAAAGDSWPDSGWLVCEPCVQEIRLAPDS